MLPRVTEALHVGVQVLLAASFAIFLAREDWISALSVALIFLLILAPRFISRWADYRLPPTLDAAIAVFIFLTLFLGEMRNFYYEYHFWDTVLHFQSGVLLGIAGFVLVFVLNGQTKKPLNLKPFFVSFFSFNFSVAMGALWEVFEYLMDVTRGSQMQYGGLPDTMIDIIFNAAGTLLVVLAGYIWLLRTSKLPLTEKKIEG
jgi:hypothetical protein